MNKQEPLTLHNHFVLMTYFILLLSVWPLNVSYVPEILLIECLKTGLRQNRCRTLWNKSEVS